jgi:hypothetical protein
MQQFLLQNLTPSIKHFYVFKNQPYKTSSSTLIPYSLSSLESIEQLYPTRHPLLNQIQDDIQNLAVDKNITFVWVPGHSDIQGNETAAKAATNLQMPPDLKMSTCDLKSKIKKESNN